MKKILLAATMLMATNMAFASAQDCVPIQNMAENAMKFRQSGIPMDKAMQLADAVAEKDEANAGVNQLMKGMITSAYAQPVRKDEAQQRSAVEGFASAVNSACMQEADR